MLPVYIKHQNVVLRDYKETDIEDEIRWYSTETEWQNYDAPWENNSITEYEIRRRRKSRIANLPNRTKITSLEIDTEDGVHIGWVSLYYIDQRYMYTVVKNNAIGVAIGIDICESKYWGKGYGTAAFSYWLDYVRKHYDFDVYTQTWSGNIRMISLAKRLGFKLINTSKEIRYINGEKYDSLTFSLYD